MRDKIFLDTSGLLCIHDGGDFRHEKAIEYFRNASGLLITNYILAEFFPLSYSRGKDRKESISFIKDVLLIPRLELC